MTTRPKVPPGAAATHSGGTPRATMATTSERYREADIEDSEAPLTVPASSAAAGSTSALGVNAEPLIVDTPLELSEEEANFMRARWRDGGPLIFATFRLRGVAFEGDRGSTLDKNIQEVVPLTKGSNVQPELQSGSWNERVAGDRCIASSI